MQHWKSSEQINSTHILLLGALKMNKIVFFFKTNYHLKALRLFRGKFVVA